LAIKTVTVREFLISVDASLIKVELPEEGYIVFSLGEGENIKTMAGMLLRMSQTPMPTGTVMRFGDFTCTYTSTGVTLKNQRSLLNLASELINSFPEVIETALNMGENARRSRPGSVQARGNAAHVDGLSGMYVEQPH